MINRLSSAPTKEGRVVWDLDWNLIRTFLVIVEEKGITAAANSLSLKQPTVSNALRRLEQRLAKRLVARAPGKFEVTPAGQLLYNEALEIFGSISRLSILIRDMDEEVSGHVTLAMASHVVSPILDEVLSTFHRSFPGATLGIDVLTSQDVVQAVRPKRRCSGPQKKPKYSRKRRAYSSWGCFSCTRHMPMLACRCRTACTTSWLVRTSMPRVAPG